MMLALVVQEKNISNATVSLINSMDVVVGLIVNSQGHVLVARRGPHQPFPHQLEFPGGKIDPNELHFDALARELNEELGIDVTEAKPVLEVPFNYQEGSVRLHVWQVMRFEKEPHGAEGQDVFWLPIKELSNSDFLHANSIIINYLQAL
jgi:8-oxo-dGTP diphosphatase